MGSTSSASEPTGGRPGAIIDLSLSLRALAAIPESERVVTAAPTIRAALAELTGRYPSLRSFLPGNGPNGHPSRLLRNGRLLRRASDLDDALAASDVLSIVPPAQVVAIHAPPDLTPDERRRYARQLALPEVGEEGQRRLKASSVLVVGSGGLGAPLALYLAAAGVGRLGILDYDVVEPDDLGRQVLHGTSGLARRKVDSACARIADLNPCIRLTPHPARITPSNALAIVREYDVVADAADDFPSRYLLNDACILLGRPNVFGSVFLFEGRVAIFGRPGGACYRCLHPEPPPPGQVLTNAEGGLIGVVPGLIGTIQATEVLKILLGLPQTLDGRMLIYDALRMRFRSVRLRRDPTCPACGDQPEIDALADEQDLDRPLG